MIIKKKTVLEQNSNKVLIYRNPWLLNFSVLNLKLTIAISYEI